MPNKSNLREFPKVKSLHGLTVNPVITEMYLTGATMRHIEEKLGLTFICEDGSPLTYGEDDLYEVDTDGIRRIL
jgi:hypothetical protein